MSQGGCRRGGGPACAMGRPGRGCAAFGQRCNGRATETAAGGVSLSQRPGARGPPRRKDQETTHDHPHSACRPCAFRRHRGGVAHPCGRRPRPDGRGRPGADAVRPVRRDRRRQGRQGLGRRAGGPPRRALCRGGCEQGRRAGCGRTLGDAAGADAGPDGRSRGPDDRAAGRRCRRQALGRGDGRDGGAGARLRPRRCRRRRGADQGRGRGGADPHGRGARPRQGSRPGARRGHGWWGWGD